MNLTINGRQVTVDDRFQSLSREEQDATVEEIAKSLPSSENTQQPSGFAAGLKHGAMEPIQGAAETLKRVAGVGPGRIDDPNYVPANVTNGSWNPAKWSLSQLPQKVAEMAPSVVPDLTAAAAGAKAGKTVGGAKGAALGGILGAMLSGTFRTAGDTTREATADRTGDPNAPSSTADIVRGVGTAGAASAAGALLPARLAGLGPLQSVGGMGALEAAKRYLGTTALGGAGAVGSDAITQAGLSVGTDKGLNIDPSRFPEAAVGGAATGALYGAPKYLADTARAGTLAKFGGDNLESTQNVATRLEAASRKLGNAKSDEAALEVVRADLRNGLGDAVKGVRSQVQLSPEADNALTRAQRGEQITPAEVALIKRETAGAPDGANTSFLAHSLHMADQMAERGGHSNRGWAGGLSGVMDKNLGFLLNPARLAGGAAATALGMHLLGTSSPLFGGALAATYGTARAVDAMTGMRSPAKTFVEHFASESARLRMPTTPQAAPPQPPTPGPAQPWGPVVPLKVGPTGPSVPPPAAPQGPSGPWGPIPAPPPLSGPTGPQVAPPAPPAPKPAWQAPQIGELWAGPNPIALAALKQKLKAGLPAEVPPAQEPATQPSFSPMALQMLKQNMKATTEEMTSAPERQAKAQQEAAKAEQLKAKEEQKQQTQAEKAQARAEAARIRAEKAEAAVKKAKDKEEAKAELVKARAAAAAAKEAAKLELAKVKAAATVLKQATVKPAPAKISKANGKFKATPEDAPDTPFAPLPEEHLYPNGITPEAYATREMGEYKARSPSYLRKAIATETARQQARDELLAKYPQFSNVIHGLHRQLQRIGPNSPDVLAAKKHYAEFVSPEAAADIMKAF